MLLITCVDYLVSVWCLHQGHAAVHLHEQAGWHQHAHQIHCALRAAHEMFRIFVPEGTVPYVCPLQGGIITQQATMKTTPPIRGKSRVLPGMLLK
jgi:hypothetical protein